MKAVRLLEHGGPEVFRLGEVPTPSLADDELLVAVKASGLNRADLLQAKGLYPPPGAPAEIPGLELAGVVLSSGKSTRRFRPGDRVMAILPSGAHAELAAVAEAVCLPIPDQLSFEEAAAIPEAFLTAFDALALQARVSEGEVVLLHAVASGVGTAAVQVVHALGAKAIGTSRSKQKLARCHAELSLDAGILIEGEPSFSTEVLRFCGDGAHAVLDLVGAPYFGQTARSLHLRGRWVLAGLLGGARAEVDLGLLLARRLHLLGTMLRPRTVAEKGAVCRAFEEQLLRRFTDGTLRAVMDRSFSSERAADAVRTMANDQTFGKLVLTW